MEKLMRYRLEAVKASTLDDPYDKIKVYGYGKGAGLIGTIQNGQFYPAIKGLLFAELNTVSFIIENFEFFWYNLTQNKQTNEKY
jgi:hypothetical protein